MDGRIDEIDRGTDEGQERAIKMGERGVCVCVCVCV